MAEIELSIGEKGKERMLKREKRVIKKISQTCKIPALQGEERRSKGTMLDEREKRAGAKEQPVNESEVLIPPR